MKIALGRVPGECCDSGKGVTMVLVFVFGICRKVDIFLGNSTKGDLAWVQQVLNYSCLGYKLFCLPLVLVWR